MGNAKACNGPAAGAYRSGMDDLAAVIRRVLAGDRDAYTDLVRAHQDMLTAYAAFRVPDAALVDEVVQQTFIRAYEQLADFDVAKDFGTWLRTICKFMIMAELKRQTRDRQNKDGYQDHLRQTLLEAALDRAEAGPDDDLLKRLQACLGKLQSTARSLVEARYRRAQKIEEIAGQVGQSVAWVATNLFRIRDVLRRCLESREAQA